MATLEQAIAFAAKQHAGQVDKANAPYILHPLRVMLNVPNIEHKIIAVLHDVLEDTETSIEDLQALGFQPHIIEAIVALTKQKVSHEYKPLNGPYKTLGACYEIGRYQ